MSSKSSIREESYDREAALADGGVPPDGVDERGEIDEDEFQRTGPARQHLTWLGAGFVVGFAVPFLFTDVMQLPEIATTAST